MRVEQTGHFPSVADRPFFISTCCASAISRSFPRCYITATFPEKRAAVLLEAPSIYVATMPWRPGATGGIRTLDLLFTKQLLYP